MIRYFPWAKVKGSPGAMTVHLSLENTHPRLLEQNDRGLQNNSREKGRVGVYYQIMYLIMKILENVECEESTPHVKNVKNKQDTG